MKNQEEGLLANQEEDRDDIITQEELDMPKR